MKIRVSLLVFCAAALPLAASDEAVPVSPDATAARLTVLAVQCFHLAGQSPPRALEFALRNQIDSAAVLGNVVHQWADFRVADAVAWAASYPPGETRDEIFSRICFVWSKNHPAEAALLAIQQIGGEFAREEAIISVLHQWGLRDLDGARNWLAGYPPGKVKTRAAAELDLLKSD